jgi:hypothetical protein
MTIQFLDGLHLLHHEEMHRLHNLPVLPMQTKDDKIVLEVGIVTLLLIFLQWKGYLFNLLPFQEVPNQLDLLLGFSWAS